MDNEAEIKFNRAYEMYFVMLYKIAFLYTGSRDDSEDILQEVFMKYLYKSPSFKDDNHEKAWLIRVTKNMCIDFKKSKKNNNLPLKECDDHSDIDAIDDGHIDVRQKLLSLDDKYK
ncbi:MAG: RNA polymerase sigma factor, partial [Eubacterium sp.]|nr:RNA polymerase sigma factor [Eubacterium sp.]